MSARNVNNTASYNTHYPDIKTNVLDTNLSSASALLMLRTCSTRRGTRSSTTSTGG